ncbi:MAG: RNA polymerase sigma factor [Verrucomicrobiota bacterium]
MNRDSKDVLSELLVIKAKAGDQRAFTDLCELWANDVLRMAWYSVKDRDGADEVTQESWLTIARSLHRLKEPGSFPAWAFSIVRRRSIDWIRQQQRERTKANAISLELEFTAEHAPEISEQANSLSEAIQSLPASDQQLLQLFYEAGLTIKEISKIINIPAGTVKSRLFTVRKNLKYYLERHQNE